MKPNFEQSLEHWPIERLLPYIRNARTHSEEQIAQIAASIAEFGFTAPILAGSDGSGTTLIACEMTGRSARLMELDPKYCDVIVRRWQDFTGKMATLESTGKTFNNLKAERPATTDAESKKC